jgi:hypothetical protein
VAAALRRELQVEVALVEGHYGEFTVLVDGDVVARGGARAVLGILPSTASVLERVRARLG